MSVRVVTMGAEKKEVPHQKDMTVAQALEAAGVKSTPDATVTVDGKAAKPDTRIKDNAQVVITPKIRQG